MIYITGDIHGDVQRISQMIEKHEITPNDIIVILGDVGMNYYGNKKGDRSRKKKMNNFGIPILCIHGNHEMRPESLITYHEDQWHDGAVYVEEEFPNLIFDKYYRLAMGYHWFPDEQPSEEIKARVENKLDEQGWQIDTVLTHTCPYGYTPTEAFLGGIDQSTVDNSTELWLDTIEKKLSYNAWYCGHWHIEKRIDKIHFLFETVEIPNAGYDFSCATKNPYIK